MYTWKLPSGWGVGKGEPLQLGSKEPSGPRPKNELRATLSTDQPRSREVASGVLAAGDGRSPSTLSATGLLTPLNTCAMRTTVTLSFQGSLVGFDMCMPDGCVTGICNPI